jgi:phage FluMu protein Com
MEKHTARLVECQRCSKTNYFVVTIVAKDGQSYYLTQCPKCKSYDEVRKVAESELKIYDRSI